MIEPVDREFLSALCLARAGLRLDADKSYLIESRLGPVARREGYVSPEAFIGALREGADERLTWAAVEAMALPESEFFRDRAVFHHVVEVMLPAMVKARRDQPVRVWCNACGTGQEVYSLAMLLADAPGLAGQVELYASDLSERCLEKAQAGIYSQFEVQRGLPARMLVRHFEKRGESFQLSPRIRQMLRWRRVNLMDDLSPFGQFDLVLCRSLLGQLAPDALAHVQGQLKRALTPGGRLVLGLKDPTGDLAPVAAAPGVFALAA
ncbi:CheR family methyltransferase [Phenylobacterium sp.]|uniref:CheR family methyltransferase n=1 Tax=Phenylobacterium sp. TaxID=1871053 RepID=UPI0025F2488B|nr:protein-glutamate O-methyltransferase CheR [Phenylobacterium sp.]